MPTINEKTKNLYIAINNVVSEIGKEGQIDSRHKLTEELMHALFYIDGGEYKPELLDTPDAALTKDAERLKCFNQIWRWKALKDGEIIYQYGEHVPALFQKTAELLPTHPPAPNQAQWQLIETAPHGKVILGFIPHSMGGYVCPTLRIELGSWNNASCAAFSEVNPTHWMPLPKPPIAAAVNAFNGAKP